LIFTKQAILERLIAAYTGSGSTLEGSFAGDVLRACADAMAQLWSMDVDGLEYRAFVSTAQGDWLTQVCSDRGVERLEGESDAQLRKRTLEKLASQPASGNADHYALWCTEVPGVFRVRVLPLNRGAGTVDIIAIDEQGKAPDEQVLASAQQQVDRNRPIGADARVLGAGETALDVTAQLLLEQGRTLDVVQAAFAVRLGEFCLEQALRTQTISYARVLQLLLETQGVSDVSALTLNGGTLSLSLAPTAVPVPGSITLTEVSA